MTMTSSRPHNDKSATAYKLAIIEQTYPGWNIRQRAGGMWSATRTSLTPEQSEAGLHRYIIQPTLEAIAAVLSQQLYIMQSVGRL